jgi:hypothetical protein
VRSVVHPDIAAVGSILIAAGHITSGTILLNETERPEWKD